METSVAISVLMSIHKKMQIIQNTLYLNMKSSDAKASKCHLKFSSLMMIFIKLVHLSSVISLK